MKRRLLLLAAALLASGSTACRARPPAVTSELAEEPARVRIGAIDWYVDYELARALARERGAPLWVHFGEHPG